MSSHSVASKRAVLLIEIEGEDGKPTLVPYMRSEMHRWLEAFGGTKRVMFSSQEEACAENDMD